jgi:hypothetical protein
MALCLIFIRRLFQFSHPPLPISNFFDLSITDEILVVEMHIWCIKIVNVLVLHSINFFCDIDSGINLTAFLWCDIDLGINSIALTLTLVLIL